MPSCKIADIFRPSGRFAAVEGKRQYGAFDATLERGRSGRRRSSSTPILSISTCHYRPIAAMSPAMPQRLRNPTAACRRSPQAPRERHGVDTARHGCRPDLARLRSIRAIADPFGLWPRQSRLATFASCRLMPISRNDARIWTKANQAATDLYSCDFRTLKRPNCTCNLKPAPRFTGVVHRPPNTAPTCLPSFVTVPMSAAGFQRPSFTAIRGGGTLQV